MEELKDNIVGIVDHYLRFHDLMTGEDAADKILSLMEKTEPVAEVPCGVGLCTAAEQLEEAAELIQCWGDYSAPYFQDKYDLQGDVDKFKAYAKLIREQTGA